MKKGIIAITLLLSGVLFISPITTNANSIKNNIESAKFETVESAEKTETKNEIIEKEDIEVSTENTYKSESNKNEVVKEEAIEKQPTKEEIVKEEIVKEEIAKDEVKSEVVEKIGMTKSDAEAVLNQYLNNSQQGDVTYSYQGDENKFEAMQAKGIRGYVFLPNIETDMAYLVDKDNGSIYYFHPSGYFEQV